MASEDLTDLPALIQTLTDTDLETSDTPPRWAPLKWDAKLS